MAELSKEYCGSICGVTAKDYIEVKRRCFSCLQRRSRVGSKKISSLKHATFKQCSLENQEKTTSGKIFVFQRINFKKSEKLTRLL